MITLASAALEKIVADAVAVVVTVVVVIAAFAVIVFNGRSCN